MFGYVRPRTDKLPEERLAEYRAAYCGLCRALGKQYGFFARFLVSYDMTFLYLLRSADRPACPAVRCHCPARLGGKKPCAADPDGYAEIAATTVILCRHKLEDDIRDSGFWKRLLSRMLKCVYARAYRKAKRRLPAFDALAKRQMERLAALERENSPSMDAAADAFAVLIRGCAGELPENILRPMQTVLYQAGRFVYLADALDDLAEDCEKNRYNPLRLRFSPENGKLTDEALDYLAQLTDASVNIAGAALNLLDLQCHTEVLENILYLGLPAVFAAVRQGSFHAKDKL